MVNRTPFFQRSRASDPTNRIYASRRSVEWRLKPAPEPPIARTGSANGHPLAPGRSTDDLRSRLGPAWGKPEVCSLPR
jgi:hypothetical protein